MKKSVLILLGILLGLLLASTTVFGQLDAYHSKPAIYRINEVERTMIAENNRAWYSQYGVDWIEDFYDALENGTYNPR